jgi:hypothetical protein
MYRRLCTEGNRWAFSNLPGLKSVQPDGLRSEEGYLKSAVGKKLYPSWLKTRAQSGPSQILAVMLQRPDGWPLLPLSVVSTFIVVDVVFIGNAVTVASAQK